MVDIDRSFRLRTWLLLLVALLIGTGCGEPESTGAPRGGESSPSPSPASPSPPHDSGPYVGAWQLVSGSSPEGAILIDDTYPVTFTVKGDTVGGTAACNEYGAEVRIAGDSFDFLSGSINQMGCFPKINEAESRFMDSLMLIDSIRRADDTLTLTGPDAHLEFELLPPPETRSLVDRKWRFEAAMEGDVATPKAHHGWIRFDSDGTMAGYSGCETFKGEWFMSGASVGFGLFGSRGSCPPELAEQNTHFETIGNGFRFEIKQGTLKLRPDHSSGYLLFRES